MILIGSRALTIRAPNLLRRAPQDFDFVSTKEEFDNWFAKNEAKVKPKKVYAQANKMIVEGDVNCEFEIIANGTSSEMLLDLVANDKETIETPFGLVPNLDMLFAIKSSHKFLKDSPHFWKTLLDYHSMKHIGAHVRDEYKSFLKKREAETYTYKHPKLNQTKDAFFSDDGLADVYVYEHDDIHKSVAIFERPAYTYYMKDGEQVQCDKNKFFALPNEYRLAGVVEEACVLAIERSLIPHKGVWNPEYAWRFALSKVCSSITSGWFREFAYENALDVLALYPKGYWEKFQRDVESGLVKPYTGRKYT